MNQYNMLESALSKKVYQGILDHYKNLDVTKYQDPVNLVIDHEGEFDEFDIRLGAIAFGNDYKMFFWFQASFEDETKSNGTCLIISIKYETIQIYKDVNTFIKDFEEILINREAIKREFLKQKSTYHQIKVIHDWLVNNNTYTIDGEVSHTPAGALVKNRGPVCEAYAEAFHMVSVYLNLLVSYGSGLATNQYGSDYHAWNYININGLCYFVDVTWDDPKDGEPTIIYDYFLKLVPSSHEPSFDLPAPSPFATKAYPTTNLAEFEVEGNNYYYIKDGNPVIGYTNLKVKDSSENVVVTYYKKDGTKLNQAPSEVGKYYLTVATENSSENTGSLNLYFEIVDELYTVSFLGFNDEVLKNWISS